MTWDPEREIKHVDELIDRVRRCLAESRAHGNTVLVDINDAKLTELIKLREILVPVPRRPPDDNG